MYFLAILASIAASIFQTIVWRKYLYIPLNVLLYLVFRKVKILRILVVLLFVLLGDYLFFSFVTFLAIHFSGFAYISFFILSAIFWFFIYGKSTYNRRNYMNNIDPINDSLYVTSVKQSTSALELSMLSIEFYLVYLALLFFPIIAIWPKLGIWS